MWVYGKKKISNLQRKCYAIKGLDRPLEPHEAEDSRISRQSAHEDSMVFSPRLRPSLPPGRIPGTHSVGGLVDSTAIVRPEGLSQ
jgi:hypothetical protein